MHISYFIQIQNPWSIDDYRECASVGAVVYDPLLDGLDEWIASQKLLTSLCTCIQKAWIEPMHILYFIQIQNPWSIDDYRECASGRCCCVWSTTRWLGWMDSKSKIIDVSLHMYSEGLDWADAYFIFYPNPKSMKYWWLPWMCLGRCCCVRDPLLDGLDEWIASQKSLTSLCICIQKAWIEPMHILYLIQIQNPWSIDDYRECASKGAVVVVVNDSPLPHDGFDEWIASQKSLTSLCTCIQKGSRGLMQI